MFALRFFRYGVSTALFAFDASDPNANGIAIASAAILSAVSLMILIYGAVIFCESVRAACLRLLVLLLLYTHKP